MMNNNKDIYTYIDYKKTINNEYQKKKLYVKSAYISSSLLLSTSPIAITNINENNILPIIITILETGLLTISLTSMKKTIKTSKKIKLIKENYHNNNLISTNNNDKNLTKTK